MIWQFSGYPSRVLNFNLFQIPNWIASKESLEFSSVELIKFLQKKMSKEMHECIMQTLSNKWPWCEELVYQHGDFETQDTAGFGRPLFNLQEQIILVPLALSQDTSSNSYFSITQLLLTIFPLCPSTLPAPGIKLKFISPNSQSNPLSLFFFQLNNTDVTCGIAWNLAKRKKSFISKLYKKKKILCLLYWWKPQEQGIKNEMKNAFNCRENVLCSSIFSLSAETWNNKLKLNTICTYICKQLCNLFYNQKHNHVTLYYHSCSLISTS